MEPKTHYQLMPQFKRNWHDPTLNIPNYVLRLTPELKTDWSCFRWTTIEQTSTNGLKGKIERTSARHRIEYRIIGPDATLILDNLIARYTNRFLALDQKLDWETIWKKEKNDEL